VKIMCFLRFFKWNLVLFTTCRNLP